MSRPGQEVEEWGDLPQQLAVGEVELVESLGEPEIAAATVFVEHLAGPIGEFDDDLAAIGRVRAASDQASACSRPPVPITRALIGSSLSATHPLR